MEKILFIFITWAHPDPTFTPEISHRCEVVDQKVVEFGVDNRTGEPIYIMNGDLVCGEEV